jgi:uncharacterized protein YukE
MLSAWEVYGVVHACGRLSAIAPTVGRLRECWTRDSAEAFPEQRSTELTT